MITEDQLPDGWWIDSAANLKALAAQLQRECPKGHSLKGKRLTALARADGSDDVLYREKGLFGPERFYCVHLTWSETNQPGYPSYTEFETLADFKDWWDDA